jgi:hypothetical protein
VDDLPDRPEPDIQLPDESGWLFDSDRGYIAQLAVHQAHKKGQH